MRNRIQRTIHPENQFAVCFGNHSHSIEADPPVFVSPRTIAFVLSSGQVDHRISWFCYKRELIEPDILSQVYHGDNWKGDGLSKRITRATNEDECNGRASSVLRVHYKLESRASGFPRALSGGRYLWLTPLPIPDCSGLPSAEKPLACASSS